MAAVNMTFVKMIDLDLRVYINDLDAYSLNKLVKIREKIFVDI